MCNPLDSSDIQDLDVYQALLSPDPSKAVGCGGISTRIFCSFDQGVYIPLHHLFCLSLSNCVMPADWSVHMISPILKSGEWSFIRNYRAISRYGLCPRFSSTLSLYLLFNPLTLVIIQVLSIFPQPVCLCMWSKVRLSPSSLRSATREYTRPPSLPHLY